MIDSADGSTTLARSLGRVGELVSYLRAEVGPLESVGPGDGVTEVVDGLWLSSQDLVDDEDWLRLVLAGTGRAIGTDDPVVSASIFVQGYAYRLLALAVACLTTSGVVPGGDPLAMAVGIGRGRVSKVAYVSPVVYQHPDKGTSDETLHRLIEETVEVHIRPLIEATRRQHRIGERMLWGNVAASASTAFRTMEGVLGDWVRPVGARFFTRVPPELQGLGSYVVLAVDGKHGWFWERTNCCLFDRIQGQPRCSDCSKTPADERRAAYEAGLRT